MSASAWLVIPSCVRSARTSVRPSRSPRTSTWPRVGCRYSPATRQSVVLPEPFGPSTTQRSPEATRQSMASRMVRPFRTSVTSERVRTGVEGMGHSLDGADCPKPRRGHSWGLQMPRSVPAGARTCAPWSLFGRPSGVGRRGPTNEGARGSVGSARDLGTYPSAIFLQSKLGRMPQDQHVTNGGGPDRVLHIRDLTVTFPDGVRAVDRVTLELRAG